MFENNELIIDSNINPNPIRDIINEILIKNLTNKDIDDVLNIIIEQIALFLKDVYEIEIQKPIIVENYLDFEIKTDKQGNKIKLLPKNLVTALWFFSLFPFDVQEVNITQKYIFDKKKYFFDYEKNCLMEENIN